MALQQVFWVFFGISGRLSSSAYLLAGLFLYVILSFLLYRTMLAPPETSTGDGWASLFGIALLASMWSNFAITAKRFHDLGKPAWFALSSLIFGFLLLLILPFFRGDPGPNAYGQVTNRPA